MPETQAVFDADEASFGREVLDRSREVPVVVDFWAPWCGPCRYLGPVLEELVEREFAGRLVLARVNTDDNPGLAQSFGIRGIPAVKVFRDGKVVAEFVGALPAEEARRVLASALPSEADESVERARALAAAGDLAGAEAAYRRALEEDPLQPEALLALGRIFEERGDLDGALFHYDRVPSGTEEAAEAVERQATVRLRREAAAYPAEERLRECLARDPLDVEAHYQLGLRLAARGRHREALEELLRVVELDRRFRDEAGRKAMLQVFEVVGRRSELADEFRSRLARALY